MQPGYPAPGYGPPAGAPGAYGPPGQQAAGGRSKPSFDPSKVSIAGWGVLGASLLTLIASFFSFWTVSGGGLLGLSVSYGGWHSWWWIPILLAVVIGVVYALQLAGVVSKSQVRPEWLAYGAAASFVLMIVVFIVTLFYSGPGSAFEGLPHSPSFGVFFALVTTAALTYFTALAAQGAGAKLPLKVPGPA